MGKPLNVEVLAQFEAGQVPGLSQSEDGLFVAAIRAMAYDQMDAVKRTQKIVAETAHHLESLQGEAEHARNILAAMARFLNIYSTESNANGVTWEDALGLTEGPEDVDTDY